MGEAFSGRTAEWRLVLSPTSQEMTGCRSAAGGVLCATDGCAATLGEPIARRLHPMVKGFSAARVFQSVHELCGGWGSRSELLLARPVYLIQKLVRKESKSACLQLAHVRDCGVRCGMPKALNLVYIKQYISNTVYIKQVRRAEVCAFAYIKHNIYQTGATRRSLCIRIFLKSVHNA